jgi:glycosyltransferase involved in cell wall biosynthesis
VILGGIVAILFGVALWNALAWPRIGEASGEAAEISVLIPARDEERNLAACLEAALADRSTVREVLVYDDHSSDGTAAVVKAYAQSDSRVRLLPPEELPAGWCGKPFACDRLARAARGEWMLFLDADARLSPDAPARMVAEARRRHASLLACWPGIRMVTFWEKVLMPVLNFVVFTLYPAPLSLRRRDASLGLAHGACLLARREEYWKVGGHATVQNELFEDTRLARIWRERGEWSVCLDGQDVVSVRMYRSLGEIWAGFKKDFYPAFRTRAGFAGFMALHAVALTWPFFWPGWPAVLVLAARAVLAARFRHPWWSIPLHPAAQLMLLALGVSSWWACVWGRGVTWKGRSYRGA